jgi:outer membrane protein TolC
VAHALTAWLGASLILNALLVVPARAADTLSLAAAQQMALQRSRGLAAQDAAATASQEMAVAAGQLPDPTLSVGVENLPVNGPDQFSLSRDFMTMRRIGLMQEFTRGEKRELRAERYRDEAAVAQAEKANAAVGIERDTAKAWLDRYYAEAMATLVADQLAQAQQQVVAAEAAYRGGRGSQADVLAARSAVLNIQDRSDDLARQQRAAVTVLARWVGTDQANATLGARPDIDHTDLDTTALDSHIAHHPDLVMLDQRATLADTEARLAAADKKADWSVELSYAQRGSAYSNMVSVGVSVPLQWDQARRQDRQVAAKLAEAEQARDERDDMRRAHVAEISTMADEWQTDRARLARYYNDLLPLAQQRTEAALAAYRGGKASLSEVLAARRDELDTRLQALHLEKDTAQVWAQLNFLFPSVPAAEDASQ